MDIKQARKLANDENTAPKVLTELAKSKDSQTRKSVATNPNTPTEILLSLCFEFPSEVINNPVIPLLLMENPLLFTCDIKLDFNQLRQLTYKQFKRLGWTKEESRTYLIKHYGKRSKLHLTDKELLDLLSRLQSFTEPGLPF